MYNQEAMKNLNKKPVTFSNGWDKFVIRHCKSAGIEWFGHGVVHDLQVMKSDAKELRAPLTALHIVNALIENINAMLELQYPREEVSLALSLCPQLLVHIINNPQILKKMVEFFVELENDMQLKLTMVCKHCGQGIHMGEVLGEAKWVHDENKLAMCVVCPHCGYKGPKWIRSEEGFGSSYQICWNCNNKISFHHDMDSASPAEPIGKSKKQAKPIGKSKKTAKPIGKSKKPTKPIGKSIKQAKK